MNDDSLLHCCFKRREQVYIFQEETFKHRSCIPHGSAFERIENFHSIEIHQKSPVEGSCKKFAAHCLPPSCCPQLTPSSLVCIFYLTINSGTHFWCCIYDMCADKIYIYFINVFIPQKVSVLKALLLTVSVLSMIHSQNTVVFSCGED